MDVSSAKWQACRAAVEEASLAGVPAGSFLLHKFPPAEVFDLEELEEEPGPQPRLLLRRPGALRLVGASMLRSARKLRKHAGCADQGWKQGFWPDERAGRRQRRASSGRRTSGGGGKLEASGEPFGQVEEDVWALDWARLRQVAA